MLAFQTSQHTVAGLLLRTLRLLPATCATVIIGLRANATNTIANIASESEAPTTTATKDRGAPEEERHSLTVLLRGYQLLENLDAVVAMSNTPRNALGAVIGKSRLVV
jgi:hypothetical protein